MSVSLTPEQQSAIAAQKARAEELNKIASSAPDPLLRIEAQNKLLAMTMQGLVAQQGLGGGLKDLLKEATAKVEPYAEMFRHIEGTLDDLDSRTSEMLARIDRLERNFKELRGGKYTL